MPHAGTTEPHILPRWTTISTPSVRISFRRPRVWCAGFPRRTVSASVCAAARLLARLHDNGPTRISELAVAERCSQPTITNHVKRLEAAQLVDRAADPRDARAWMIKLTKKGNQQLASMRDSIGTSPRALSRDDVQA